MTGPSLSRRDLLVGIGGTALAGCSGSLIGRSEARSLSITVDDFDIADGPLMSATQRHAALLRALDQHHIRACGFPAGKHIDHAEGRRLLSIWSERGHAVGCHSYEHVYYGGKDPARFAADLDRALPLVAKYPTSVPLFRFPFLGEGRTAEGRFAARAALASRGLRNGHVTIDTSDWFISGRLSARLKADPTADVAPYRQFYIAHLLDRADFYDRLARDVLGHAIPHTLLLHHNIAAALFLGDALAALRSKGWQLIDASAAFAHPVYRRQPDIAPAGHSLPWQLARESRRFDDRLRTPAEDGKYEKPTMDRLKL